MTVTRFAPSPTGYLHVGNLRTALMNWLIARQNGGTFILRFDDTDPERSKEEYVDAIREDLEWLGLDWDREERQSRRLDRYEATADHLRALDRLYPCFETPAELEIKRRTQLAAGRPPVYDRSALRLSAAEREALLAEHPPHWRFKLAPGRIEWVDGILAAVSIDTESVSDPVLIRGDGQILYTLASVVDDVEMGVTHVVRGADHVTNTGAQIQIMSALDKTPPEFAHHSLLTGPKGESLSKRLGTLSIRDLRAQGLEPMALISLLARLGTSDPVEPKTDLQVVIDGFDIARFGAAPTKFDSADLSSLSTRVLREQDRAAVDRDLEALQIPESMRDDFWEAVRENVDTRADLQMWWNLCRDGVPALVEEQDMEFVRTAFGFLPPKPWNELTWSDWTNDVKGNTGRKGKTLFLPLRRALTGRDRGPDMSKLLPLLQAAPPSFD